MSMNSFTEFLKKVQQDAGLQKELRVQFGDPAAGIPGKALADFAAGKGYRFTVEEIPGELSDEKLGGVAGGTFNAFQKADSFARLESKKYETPGPSRRVFLNFSTPKL